VRGLRCVCCRCRLRPLHDRLRPAWTGEGFRRIRRGARGRQRPRAGKGPAPVAGRRRRVESAWVKRVTPTQSFDRKQAPTERAVPLNAREGVGRARRLEAAHRAECATDQQRQSLLIDADERDQQVGEHGCRRGTRSGFGRSAEPRGHETTAAWVAALRRASSAGGLRSQALTISHPTAWPPFGRSPARPAPAGS
jgi:hypothetical protein